MTRRNFIHGSRVFSGYRDDQVKTKHIRVLSFPTLITGKEVGGGRSGGGVTVEVKQTAIVVIFLR